MRPRNLVFFILLIGLGLFIYLRPQQTRVIYARANATLTEVLGKKTNEYEGAKSYYYASAVLVRNFNPDLTLVLTDGSRWLARDTGAVSAWAIGQNITIEHAKDSKFPYMLINEESGNRVNARYLGKE